MRRLVFIAMILLLLITVSAVEVNEQVYQLLEEQDEVEVIVVLEDQDLGVQADQQEMIKGLQRKVLNRLELSEEDPRVRVAEGQEKNYDLALQHQYSQINGFSGKLTRQGLAKLEDDPAIKEVIVSGVKQIFLDQSIPLVNADDVWNITINNISVNGTGKAVCILDTGVNYNHSYLGGGWGNRVIGGYDFVNSDTDPNDDHGHGTHVAGIVAAAGAKTGVARGVNIVAFKVCNSGGSCSDANVLAGLEWCIDNATIYNISAISISLGAGLYTSYCDSDSGVDSNYATLINSAITNNISVMIATGNSDTICTAGLSTGIASPACIENATRITASDDADAMGTYACRHINFTDTLTAPGTSITSTYIGSTTATATRSGTSMATPHMSAAAALLQQFAELQGNSVLTTQDVEDTLNSTGTFIFDSSETGLNFSRLNVFAAIINSDTTGPPLSYIAPTPDDNASAETVTINISSTESLWIAYLEWNGTNETMQGSGTNFFAIKQAANANYTYLVYGFDYANNSNTTGTRTVVIENVAPAITFTTPTNNSYHNSNFNLSVLVTDDNVSYSSFNITNSSSHVVQSNSTLVDNTTFTWNDLVNLTGGNLTDGNYSLYISANDTYDTYSSSEAIFVVDTINPSLFDEARSPTVVQVNDTVVFSANATDLNLQLVYLETNYSGTWQNITMNLTDTNKFSHNTTGLTSGSAVGYRFIALDLAGNTNASTLTEFNVNNSPVSFLNITAPLEGQLLELGELISFAANATDPDNDTLTYSWDFGDGVTSSSATPTHAFNATGNHTITLNVSDGSSSLLDIINVTVNDSIAPSFKPTYPSSVHTVANKSFILNVLYFDFSGLNNTAGILVDDVVNVLPTTDTYCNNPNSTARNCSWNITITTSIAGTHSMTFNATDNSSSLLFNTSTFSIAFTNCTDGTKNGDETGTDCGGSCSACSSSSSSSSSGGSSTSAGGGGGGGGAVVSTTSDDAEDETSETTGSTPDGSAEPTPETEEPTADAALTSFTAGEPTLVTFTGVVSQISVISSIDRQANINVQSLEDKPEEVDELDRKVYQYLQIDTDLTAEELDKVIITFTVPKTWLEEHGFSKRRVALYHYDGIWEKLRTKVVEETEEQVTFEANAEHFSYFAVAAKEGFNFGNWTTGAAAFFMYSSGSSKPVVLILLILAIIALLVVYFFVREKDFD